MEVPSDYVLDIVKKTLVDKIDSLNKIMESNHIDNKRDITEIKTTLNEFKTKFEKDITAVDLRVRRIEQEYQFEKGKITIIVLFIGVVVTIAINFLMWLYSKLGK